MGRTDDAFALFGPTVVGGATDATMLGTAIQLGLKLGRYAGRLSLRKRSLVFSRDRRTCQAITGCCSTWRIDWSLHWWLREWIFRTDDAVLRSWTSALGERNTVNIVAGFDNRLPFLLFLAGRARGTKRQRRESALLTDQRCGKLHAISRAMTASFEPPSFSGGLLGGVEREDSATWLDRMVGLRGRYSFTPEFYLTGWGLVGGGGADIDWDVALGIGYEFNERISAIAGYRALGVDYSDDGFIFDAVQQGPILGVALKF
jgi:hypothetical protein